MLPEFYDGENLPQGNHPCTWDEFTTRFAYNGSRRTLATRLQTVLATAKNCHFLAAVIFGSFITSKEEPGDVDIVWVVEAGTQKEQLPEPCQRLLEHDRSKQRFGCDLWFFYHDGDVLERINSLWGYTREYPRRRGLVIIDLGDYEPV